MSLIWGTGKHLTNGSVRFVTRRAALTVAACAAFGSAALALSAGIVIGRDHPGRVAASDGSDSRVRRDYTITELGKLNASEGAPQDAEGGPSLPPRRCDEQISHPARDAAAVHDQIACLAVTLSALEQEVTIDVANWESFPGRMPVDGARFGSPFGNRVDPFTHRLSFHPGVDLVATTGTPILAAAGGRVIHAGPQGGYGNAFDRPRQWTDHALRTRVEDRRAGRRSRAAVPAYRRYRFDGPLHGAASALRSARQRHTRRSRRLSRTFHGAVAWLIFFARAARARGPSRNARMRCSPCVRRRRTNPSCVASSASDGADDALARAQLALRQQAASRASVQRSADALTAEVRQLQAQVLFLQGQSRTRR
jgi:hypothetical protein